jgi:hypothetical protein
MNISGSSRDVTGTEEPITGLSSFLIEKLVLRNVDVPRVDELKFARRSGKNDDGGAS